MLCVSALCVCRVSVLCVCALCVYESVLCECFVCVCVGALCVSRVWCVGVGEVSRRGCKKKKAPQGDLGPWPSALAVSDSGKDGENQKSYLSCATAKDWNRDYSD